MGYSIAMGQGKLSYYRMATIAMLFGTGELLFALAMHGNAQLGMIGMVIASYFLAGTWYYMDKKENDYMSVQELYK